MKTPQNGQTHSNNSSAVAHIINYYIGRLTQNLFKNWKKNEWSKCKLHMFLLVALHCNLTKVKSGCLYHKVLRSNSYFEEKPLRICLKYFTLNTYWLKIYWKWFFFKIYTYTFFHKEPISTYIIHIFLRNFKNHTG